MSVVGGDIVTLFGSMQIVTSVTVNGVAATPIFAGLQQVRFLAPPAAAPGPASVVVTNATNCFTVTTIDYE